jgi:RNA polymerase sigma factor (sigma-70 family)
VWRFLVSSAGRADAEDCFQETFLAALRAYPRLRPGSNLRAWVLTIAHRKALDAHRGRARRPLPIAEAATVADGHGEGARGIADGANGASTSALGGVPLDTNRELWEAVGALAPRQRSAVTLRYVGDLTHRDIAAALGCSEQAARRSLHDGLTNLRKAIT